MKEIRPAFLVAAIHLLLGASGFIGCLGSSSGNGGATVPPGLSGQFDCLPSGIDVPADVQVERSATGSVQTIALEDYVKGVLPKEIGTSFPVEAMKAQAVAARTYVASWVASGKGPICDTTQCQVYGDDRYDVTNQAVDATAGVIGIYGGEIIQAVFAASCGGHTENVEDVWGNYFAYLRAVSCIENEICTGDCTDWPSVSAPVCDSSEAGCCYGRNGHGVGMCQRGAQAMAECGYGANDILTHYYSGVTLAKPCADSAKGA